MTKARLEGLSDGVFAIVMTMLVFNIQLPEEITDPTPETLLAMIKAESPFLVAYFISFFVLATYWVSHNYLVSIYAKNVDRRLVYLNLFYLMFIGLIPFSARLIGNFNNNSVATIFYGINMLAISVLSYLILNQIIQSKEIENIYIEPRRIKYSYFRLGLPVIFASIGIAVSVFSTGLSLFFYAFPTVFNFLPASLTETDKKVRKWLAHE